MAPPTTAAKVPPRRFAQLNDARVLDVADASRAAAVGFLEGTATGWGHLELGAWLAGPYRLATRRAGEVRSVASLDDGCEEGTLERVLLSTRERLIALLAAGAQTWGSDGFAEDAAFAGLVFGVTDASGALGYAPLALSRMPLYDRVAALFIADYLTRPRDYDAMSLCDECAEIAFGWSPAHHRYCSDPPATSALLSVSVRKCRPDPCHQDRSASLALRSAHVERDAVPPKAKGGAKSPG